MKDSGSHEMHKNSGLRIANASFSQQITLTQQSLL